MDATHMVRCECEVDCWLFVGKASDFCEKHDAQIRLTNIEFSRYGGCVVSIKTTLTLELLRELMRTVSDGHVMVESVNVVNEFTGDRYWHDVPDEAISS